MKWIDVGTGIANDYSAFFIIISILYTPMIFYLKGYMNTRAPLKLKGIGFFWNLMISLFSAAGAMVFLIYDPKCLFISVLPQKSYHPYVGATVVIFSLTKWIEYGDTVLLLLRKKPLIFLHWYHHLSVCLYCWYAQKICVAYGHNCIFINLCIHAWMYLYYALAILSPRHPFLQATRSSITTCQTAQMFVGMYVAYKAAATPNVSSELRSTALFGFAMYASYAYLFTLFYLDNYVRNVRSKMAITITVLHLTACMGAISLWNHKSRFSLLIELAISYLFTVKLFSNLCRPKTLEITSFPNSKTDSKLTQGLADKHVSFEKQLVTSTLTDSRFSRTILLLQNPFVTWSLEGQIREKLTKQAMKDDDVAILSNKNPTLLGHLINKSFCENSKQQQQEINPSFASIAEDWFMFGTACAIPGIYGLYFYQDLLLGLLVHGCLRWCIEIHTAGRLV